MYNDKVESEQVPQKMLAETLGSETFKRAYGIKYAYYAGAMYRGIGSKEVVIAMGKADMLAFLGTGGMSLDEISQNIDAIQSELNRGQAYGMNLLHNPVDMGFEMQTIELYLEKGIQHIEASAYMQMVEPLVYYNTVGLSKDAEGKIINQHRIIAKVSRPEVAECFMRPAPENILNKLLEKRKITDEQASLSKQVPVSYDVCVEADSGGHTDSGVAMVLLPSIQQLKNSIEAEYHYPQKIHVGLAGGIGTPQSAASAFIMGADFIVTGSINQCTVESGASDEVKDLLESINVQDTTYAPAGDMFESGAKVQVLKKGLLFAARGNKLYELYSRYDSLDDIPDKMITTLEKKYFKKPMSSIWMDVKKRLESQGRLVELQHLEKMPKAKMSAIFRWYFGFSTSVAFAGDLENKVDFQVHTGPSIGAFNQWVKGTDLESWKNRHVDKIGQTVMEDTAKIFQKI